MKFKFFNFSIYVKFFILFVNDFLLFYIFKIFTIKINKQMKIIVNSNDI